MKLLVINGPNLNFLGIREPEVYGTETYADLVAMIREKAEEVNCEIEVFQSNHRTEILAESLHILNEVRVDICLKATDTVVVLCDCRMAAVLTARNSVKYRRRCITTSTLPAMCRETCSSSW